ncbi:MAG TPA: recombination protein NinB [Roseateles sp.]
MSERKVIQLDNAAFGHGLWVEAWRWCKAMLIAGHRLTVEIKTATRSTEQNALMWSCLNDLSKQVDWPVDGRTQKLDPEEWKDILSAGLKKAQRVAQGIEGGWVMLGQRTSRMTVAEMSELITLAHAFGDQHGVKWSRTSLGRNVPEEAFA